MHHCVLGKFSFRSFWSIWMQRPKIPLQKGLQVYRAMCVSTMLYNCSSWAAPKTILNKLDACHRRHLHSILDIHWPHNTISNEALYKQCNTRPTSEMVKEARWNMLGHVLCIFSSTECTTLCSGGHQEVQGQTWSSHTQLPGHPKS